MLSAETGPAAAGAGCRQIPAECAMPEREDARKEASTAQQACCDKYPAARQDNLRMNRPTLFVHCGAARELHEARHTARGLVAQLARSLLAQQQQPQLLLNIHRPLGRQPGNEIPLLSGCK